MSWLSISSYIPSKNADPVPCVTGNGSEQAPPMACLPLDEGASETSPRPRDASSAAVDAAGLISEDSKIGGERAPLVDGKNQKRYGRGLSGSIYAWFYSNKNKTGLSDCSDASEPLERPEQDHLGSPKSRQSTFWFSYSSASAAETLAGLGDAADVPACAPALNSLMWISDPASSHGDPSTAMPELRSMASGASLDEVALGEKGQYFSLVECQDVSGHGGGITCCSCGLPVAEYVVLAEDGAKWHAKCFATAMCPDEGESSHDVTSEDCVDIFDDVFEQCSSPSIAHHLNSGDSLDDSTNDWHEEAHLITEMTHAISWAVGVDVSRIMGAGKETCTGVPDQVPGPPSQTTPAVDEDYSAGLLSSNIENSKVEASISAERSLSHIDTPVKPEGQQQLDALMVELHELGLFDHNYYFSETGFKMSQIEIERQADQWACKVGNVIDRSVSLFPLEMYQSKEKYEGGSAKHPVSCVSHASTIMHCIRLKFGITIQEYASSFLMGEVEGGEVGEGKSGKRLWFTKDRRFVVKVLGNQEFTFLIRILRSYYNHMIANGSHTLICRFMGLYTITVGSGYATRIVVMNNVFYHPPNPMAPAAFVVMDELYDIKGSAINRCVTQEDLDAGVSVMKDLNFCANHNGTDTKGRPIHASDGTGVCRKLPFDAAFSAMLRADIENDCAWLSEAGIMDYSLLIGTGHLEFSSSVTGAGVAIIDPVGPAFKELNSVIRRRNSDKNKDFKRNSMMNATTPHPLCRENSLHSSFQDILQTVPWRSVWQEHWGGVSCIYSETNLPSDKVTFSGRKKVSIGEPAILFVGIETAYKMKLLATMGQDPNLISAIDAYSYAERFTAFIESHL